MQTVLSKKRRLPQLQGNVRMKQHPSDTSFWFVRTCMQGVDRQPAFFVKVEKMRGEFSGGI
jgi:hypothetical protein